MAGEVDAAIQFPGASFAVGGYPRAVALGDFDGDTILDLISANLGSDGVSVLLGTGGVGFQTATQFAAGDFSRAIVVTDLDGDRHV